MPFVKKSSLVLRTLGCRHRSPHGSRAIHRGRPVAYRKNPSRPPSRFVLFTNVPGGGQKVADGSRQLRPALLAPSLAPLLTWQLRARPARLLIVDGPLVPWVGWYFSRWVGWHLGRKRGVNRWAQRTLDGRSVRCWRARRRRRACRRRGQFGFCHGGYGGHGLWRLARNWRRRIRLLLSSAGSR